MFTSSIFDRSPNWNPLREWDATLLKTAIEESFSPCFAVFVVLPKTKAVVHPNESQSATLSCANTEALPTRSAPAAVMRDDVVCHMTLRATSQSKQLTTLMSNLELFLKKFSRMSTFELERTSIPLVRAVDEPLPLKREAFTETFLLRSIESAALPEPSLKASASTLQSWHSLITMSESFRGGVVRRLLTPLTSRWCSEAFAPVRRRSAPPPTEAFPPGVAGGWVPTNSGLRKRVAHVRPPEPHGPESRVIPRVEIEISLLTMTSFEMV